MSDPYTRQGSWDQTILDSVTCPRKRERGRKRAREEPGDSAGHQGLSAISRSRGGVCGGTENEGGRREIKS